MTSSTTTADCVDTSPLDPSKHVNFVQGMVLGVDDFQQEFSWHAGRHRALARELAGYGTVSGLKLAIEGKVQDNLQVTVEPGLAVTPAGELARITRKQCAGLTAWLAREENRRHAPQMLGSPGRLGVRVYVRLRYADCKLDPVPIPGEPCRTEDESMQASRVADSWKLQLGFDPPHQREEDAVRALVHWFKRIQLVEHPAATPAALVRELRKAAAPLLDANDTPGELTLLDPPEDFFIARADLCECLRAALLVWTTELRPKVQERLHSGGGGCGCSDTATSPPASALPEQDVLLGELWLPVIDSPGGLVLDSLGEPELHEEERPYLLHLRMLQELVTCGPDATGEPALATFATILAQSDDTLWVWVHHPLELDVSGQGAVSLAVNGAAVSDFSVRSVPSTTNVFELRVEGSVPLALGPGDRVTVSFAIDVVRELTTGHTLRLALDESYGGYLDQLGGFIHAHTIVGPLALDDLIDVSTADAQDDLVLTSRGGVWRPEAVPRVLNDLGDVDSDGVSGGDGLVLTLRDERWSPEPVPRVLDDLGDVDSELSTSQNGDVLTHRDGRWQPESVPRSLDDLSNVDSDGVSSQDGDVLTLRDGRWSPEPAQSPPHQHALAELSDVDLGSVNEGDVLTRRGGAWVSDPPKAPPTPTPVHSGLLKLNGIQAGSVAWFGPFSHGLGDRVVMIRFALELAKGAEVAENVDTISPLQTSPHLVAGIPQGTGRFFVFLQDERKPSTPLPPPANYVVRWFAVPVTNDLGVKEASPIDLDKAPDDALRRRFAAVVIPLELAAGHNKLDDLASRLRIAPGDLRSVLKDIGFRVVNGVVAPTHN